MVSAGTGMQPLRGLVVLDLSKVWIGPTVSHLLSDFGARVIEIRSRAVDIAEEDRFGNFVPLAYDGSIREYTDISRNRESVTLNLTKPEGIEIFKRLVPHVDMVVENFSARVMGKFGLSYDTLSAINPRLIMLSMTAAGQTGPWRTALTYAPSLTALYGGKSLIGYPDNQRVLEDASEMDPMNAIYGVIALCMAVRHRHRTGEGGYIDLAQGEAILQGIADATLDYTMNGHNTTVTGNHHHLLAPHSTYPTTGGTWVSIAVATGEEWRALCAAIGKPAWATDPGFADVAGRHEHEVEIDAAIAAFTSNQDAQAVTEALQAAGVAAYPVHDGYGLMADPHLAARRSDLLLEVEGIDREQIWYGIPWQLRGTPGSIKSATPPYGAQNEKILGEWLGLSTADVQRLREEQVVY